MTKSTPLKKLTIGVFLPVGFRGGSLRGAKNIVKMLKLGSQSQGNDINLIFSCVANLYDIKKEFSDLIELDIAVRETHWQTIWASEIEIPNSFKQHFSPTKNQSYLLPNDGICNFNDCDFWLLISDRTFPPLAPLKPYGVVIYDYVQRYMPYIYSPDNFESYCAIEHERIKTVRNACFAMVTTPQTYNDVIQYVGLNKDKIILIPIEFSLPGTGIASERKTVKPYFIWTTNITPHKNHLRALEALKIYYDEYKGTLDVIVTGQDTMQLKNDIVNNVINTPYLQKIRTFIKDFPILQSRLTFLGNVSDKKYAQILSGAKFLWHPTIIDNGTFSVIEAAYYNVPSLSSDYPQMRYINECFQLNLLFSNPLHSQDMAKKLSIMENTYSTRSALLPNQDYLQQFTYNNLAVKFWETIQSCL